MSVNRTSHGLQGHQTNLPALGQHIKKGLRLGLDPEEIAEALMVCVNPAGSKVLSASGYFGRPRGESPAFE